MENLRLSAPLQARAGKPGRLRIVASTERIDSQRRIFRSSGWELARFRSNPVLLWSHGQDPRLGERPIGNVPKIGIENGELIAHVERIEAGLIPEADELWALVDAGLLRGASIGAVPTKPGRYIEEDGQQGFMEYDGQELVELSLTSVPSNADTLMQAARFLAPTFADVALQCTHSAEHGAKLGEAALQRRRWDHTRRARPYITPPKPKR